MQSNVAMNVINAVVLPKIYLAFLVQIKKPQPLRIVVFYLILSKLLVFVGNY